MPWLQEAKRRHPRDVERYYDCERCMEQTPPQQRRLMGCGFLPLRDDAEPWDGAELGRVPEVDELHEDRRRLRLPVCPGFVCGLPEVIEASRALHWKQHGELTQFCGGQASPELIAAIDVLELEQSRLDEWRIKNPHREES